MFVCLSFYRWEEIENKTTNQKLGDLIDKSFGVGFMPVFSTYEEAKKYGNCAKILKLTPIKKD